MTSSPHSGKDKTKQNMWKQKAKATLDGLMVKPAAKRTHKVVKSIIDTNEQSASKPAAKTCKTSDKTFPGLSSSMVVISQVWPTLQVSLIVTSFFLVFTSIVL